MSKLQIGTANKIRTEPNTKNLILETPNALSKVCIKSNEVIIENNITISGSINNFKITDIENSLIDIENNISQISLITNQINISGVSFESIDTNFAKPSDISNILQIISNLDTSFVDLNTFNDFSNNIYNNIQTLYTNFTTQEDLNNYALDASLNEYAKISDLNNYALDASLNEYAKISDLNNYALDASLNIYALDASLNEYAKNSDLSIYALDASLNIYAKTSDLNNYALDASLNGYAKTSDLSIYALDASLNVYAKTSDLNNYALDASLNGYAKTSDLSIYALDASLNEYAKTSDLNNYALDASLNEYAKNSDLLNELSGHFITREELDVSFQTISSLSISGDFITREEFDASFQTISSTSISGDFVTKYQFDLSYNDLQNRSDNFFFFFKLKPWGLVYKNGFYNYPITNYGNNFTYNLGNYNSSFIDNLSSITKNLQLQWKIPPRIFLDSTLTINNINYLPIYNNLIVEFKEQNELNWRELLNINNFPDPSNNSSYTNYNNKNDENMIFIFNLTRNTGQTNDTNNINIIDNSFNINYSGGLNNFQNSKAYQFRIFLSNISNLQNTFDYKIDSYGYDTSNIYLYFPDNSGEYFLTASRGSPKAPTNLTFISIQFNNTTINGSLNDSTADTNNIISIPLESNDDNDNKLVFSLSLLANKNNDYKKYIPYSLNNFNLHNITNLSNPSSNGQFSLLQTSDIEPEFTYDLSNYGMSFANNILNISYANNILTNQNISNNFTTPAPLRNQVNSSFNNFISNGSYTLFNSNLKNYNSNLDFKTIKWRENNQNYNFYFFNDSNSIFTINSNNLNYKLFNSLKSITANNINTNNEPKGIDFIDNNLCSFIMYSQKIKNSVTSNIYTPFQIDTSFNNFQTTTINNSNSNYSFNYISQDILPNGLNSINDYSKKNGYYVGLILNDLLYNIDLNDFFDTITDLCFNNIKLKTSIIQNFDSLAFNKEQEYVIYKITNDISQNIYLDNISSSFNLTYNESNQGIYFGLTSIKPHTTNVNLLFSGTLNNLSKYIRSYNNNVLSNINLRITGSLNSNNSTNINWEESSNNTTQNISHNYNYFPLSNLNQNYGYYDGNYSINSFSDVTIYNNVFSNSATVTNNNLSLGNIIDISNKYFWNIGRLGNSNNYFKDNNMIVFNNNPLSNSYNVYSGINYDPYDITLNGIIKYNQALYQNNGIGLFYSSNNSSIYKDYSNYINNNNSNLNYSVFNISGDIINYNIGNYFLNGLSKNINNTFKWICFDIDLTSNPLASDNITLEDTNSTVNDIGGKIVFYIKLKYVQTQTQYFYNPITKQNMTYSGWLDCQAILSGNPNYVSSTNLAGIFSNNSPFGTYPLPLTLPNLSSKATNLILLVGITNGYNFNINNLNIIFNV